MTRGGDVTRCCSLQVYIDIDIDIEIDIDIDVEIDIDVDIDIGIDIEWCCRERDREGQKGGEG